MADTPPEPKKQKSFLKTALKWTFRVAVMGVGNIIGKIVKTDKNGDRRYLMCIADNYGGGPVGVETLAAALSEQRDMIEDVIEPYLMQQGLVQRTPRGRVISVKGYSYLGLAPPQTGHAGQEQLL